MEGTVKDILSRRSIKRYRPEMVPAEALNAILEAGTYAPTGMNRQSPIIVAITNKAVRDQLSRLNASIMGASSDPFYGAPVVLVVLAKKDSGTRLYDGSLVMGNLLLAAHALGLGACWIHRAKEEFETAEGAAILARLGIAADEYEGIGHCILGYPDGEIPAVRPRKENYIYRIE